MAAELPQFKDSEPMITPQHVNSKASGYEAFARTLGSIADESAKKVADMAEEASQGQLLQQQGMMSDLENNTKIEMYKNPGQAVQIAEKAAYTAETIKHSASLNKADRVKFNYLADNTMRDIQFSAAKSAVDMNREQIKYTTLATFDSTLNQIKEKLYTDPKGAGILIDAQYKMLPGLVATNSLTAHEASILHNHIEEEILRAQHRGSRYRSGNATAADLNAIESYPPIQTPFSNASLPMDAATNYQTASYLNHLSAADIKSTLASGASLPANALMFIKSDEQAMALQHYKLGAAQANGKIQAGQPWQELKKEAELYNTKHAKLSTEQEGYRDRLNNHIIGIEKGGQYASYVANTPAGAQASLEFNRQNAVIDQHIYTGNDEQVGQQKNAAKLQNLNQYISRLNAIGVGIDIPDQYRNAVPPQYTAPIAAAFTLGSDPSSAINMIAAFDKNNRPYVASAMPDARKQLTVYEVGQMLGKADAGFLSSFWKSQQDGINYKGLQVDDKGMTNPKIKDAVMNSLGTINGYLSRLPNGPQLVSASSDKAIRFVKYKALANNDPTFAHIDDYVKEYANNMGRAYDVQSSSNYQIDKNVIPLEKPQMSIVASHALSETYKSMEGYMNHEEVMEYISRNQPYVISTQTGRLVVVDQFGRAIADKNGHAAFDHFYSEGLLQKAQHDNEAVEMNRVNPFAIRGRGSLKDIMTRPS